MTDSDLTLTSWIAATAEAVKLATNEAEAKRQAQYLQVADEQLSPLENGFRLLLQAAEIVRDLGWDGVAPTPQLLIDLGAAGGTLEARLLIRVAAELWAHRTLVQRSMVEVWGKHATSKVGDVEELLVLAGTLSGVDGVAEVSTRLQEILGHLAQVDGSIPTLKTVELLYSAEDVLRQLENSLKPESVRSFLSAVARGGASTDLLTTDVVTWLKKHHALGNFKVVAGAPTSD
jgi:hypothetical protein